MTWQRRALDRYYDRSKGWLDGTEEFHALVRPALVSGARILEVGSGPSNPTSEFLASAGDLTGLDVDPAVRTNRFLRRAEVFDGRLFPFDDGSFDVCVSDYVLEHVADPALHFGEVRRVLRPGGAYAFRTPNRWHYVTLVSSLTPHWFHELVANRLRGLPPEAHDPYPTVYAANTARAVRRAARGAGLTVDLLRLVEKEPSYGMASRLLFYPFLAYERFVNSSVAWDGLRANILARLRKPAA